MKSFGSVIAENKGYTSGFDYMRLILAVSVVAWHSLEILHGGPAVEVMAQQKWAIVVFMILPMFFCLSGFLVSASLVRSRHIWEFIGLRALRILPALAVEVTLSALILGPSLTTTSLSNYFTLSEFHAYFLNIIGIIHFNLPGVFLLNPVMGIVNSSLWTVPFELECYLTLFGLAILGIVKRPVEILLLFAIAVIAAVALFPTAPGANMQGHHLVMSFVAGMTLFMWRNKIPYHPLIFIACLSLCILKLKSSDIIYLVIIPMAYVTAYLGLLTPKKLPIIFIGDYSYGVYLYAFPIQQAVYQLLPSTHTWALNFFISIILVGLFAAFSWHCIEKPTLKLKRYLKKDDITISASIPRSVS